MDSLYNWPFGFHDRLVSESNLILLIKFHTEALGHKADHERPIQIFANIEFFHNLLASFTSVEARLSCIEKALCFRDCEARRTGRVSLRFAIACSDLSVVGLSVEQA
jgi:hypothetical protein